MSGLKLKNGSEYSYCFNKNSDPVSLAYIEPLADGRHRFFSIEHPTMDYHLHFDSSKFEEVQKCVVDPGETYVVFAGRDEEKRKAYISVMKRRGVKPEC